jgi:hypothetical protein
MFLNECENLRNSIQIELLVDEMNGMYRSTKLLKNK